MNCTECLQLEQAYAEATILAVRAESDLIVCPLEQWQNHVAISDEAEIEKRICLYKLLHHKRAKH